jgi:uncharacterized protein YndB with AHSA1/START domain
MSTSNTPTLITIEANVHAPIEKVWTLWTDPKHIVNWNNASPDWHTPHAENDVRTGGKFKSTMAAKDGSMQFDFEGTYTAVELHKKIEYTLTDKRRVQIAFQTQGNAVHITEHFEAETQNTFELQKMGWQAILDNFKKYVEEN